MNGVFFLEYICVSRDCLYRNRVTKYSRRAWHYTFGSILVKIFTTWEGFTSSNCPFMPALYTIVDAYCQVPKFDNNTANFGGGIALLAGSMNLDNSSVHHNTAHIADAGVRITILSNVEDHHAQDTLFLTHGSGVYDN